MNDIVLLDELAQLAALRIGLRIPEDARDRFIGILRIQARRRGYSTLDDYRNFLASRQATEEWEELARTFTTGETFFFRDHGQFDLMRLRLLPELIARHCSDKTLRLWSAGCASGEEAYSLAMLVDMLLPERADWNILILGTDIDSKAIAKARRGHYGRWSFRMFPAEMQQRYFLPQTTIRDPQSDEWVLDERILRMVTFRVSNLVSEPFPDSASELHDMDMILCRNVFIYFAAAAVTAVAVKFAATLRSGGYLLPAHTELTGHAVHELKSKLYVEGVVYQRREQAPAPAPAISRVQMREPSQFAPRPPEPPRLPAQAGNPQSIESLLNEARAYADQGEFDLAEQACRKTLAVDPLAVAPYFLLAQLAQSKGDYNQAKDCLNKAIYLDHRFVAAYLELAALGERTGDMSRARILRRAALGIVRAMPGDMMIEQYETTAKDLTRWLAQWEHEPTAGT